MVATTLSKYQETLGDHIYMIYLLLEFSALNLYAIATSFQYMLEAF